MSLFNGFWIFIEPEMLPIIIYLNSFYDFIEDFNSRPFQWQYFFEVILL